MTFNPEQFGKYILLEKLAAGGMAEVFLAKLIGAENVAKYIAIKRILPQFSQNQEFIEMFKEEAKIAINLSSSNIVPIYDFDESNGQFFLVMEYIAGRNLRQILNRLGKINLRLSLDQIVYVISEVSRGLDHAHRCVDKATGKPLNITHRDMSPQNVMISFEGEVKIVDFGIAKAESKIENTKAGTLKGKFGYMSPEQAEGQEVDYRTDIFSIGIVLWELIAGDRLFIANNEVNTLRKIKDCVVPSLRRLDPSIPAEIERIANKALARDRNLRYQSAADLHRDLSRFLNRQFPDFTAQDFSTFIKTIFEKERDETRQKMIEYSKVQASSFNEKTEYIGGTVTRTVTEPGNSNEPQMQNFVAENKVRAEDISLELQVKRHDLLKSTVNTPVAEHTNTGGTRSHSGLPFGSSTSYTTTANTSSTNWVARALLFIALAGGAYLFASSNPDVMQAIGLASKSASDNGQSNLSSSSPKPNLEQEQAPTESRPSTVRVSINSLPQDAEIFVNGVKHELMTPAQIELPYNQVAKIKVTRRGYAPYETEVTPQNDGQEVRASLVKRSEGYVSVKARPGTLEIYIDGKLVSRNGEVKEYPVKPDTEVLIQAYNRATKAQDVKRIKVKENSVSTLEMYVRQPSSVVPNNSTTKRKGTTRTK